MVAPRGEGTGGCARGRWATSIKRKPAVNIASPVLRTRCCGGFLSDRGENRDPGLATMNVKKIIDKGGAIREQAHQQLKEELGLDHFEGRSWTGLHRHALMTMIAYAFLQSRRVKAAGRKKRVAEPPPQPSMPAIRQAILNLFARPPPRRCPHCEMPLTETIKKNLPK